MADWFLKDPEEVLDYQIDWSNWLGGDTISTSAWEAETGVTVDSSSNTDSTAAVFLSGGTLGNRYLVTNQIVTAGGRTVERSLLISIAAK